MTHQDDKLLRLWAAGPDIDQYRHVRHEFGFNQAKSRREVRAALHRNGWYPHTSDDYEEVRQRIRKGDFPGNQLI